MRYLLQLSILLVVLGTSAAFGADRIRLAQTQTAPALPPPQLLPQAYFTQRGVIPISDPNPLPPHASLQEPLDLNLEPPGRIPSGSA
jgi:hypothetical protein